MKRAVPGLVGYYVTADGRVFSTFRRGWHSARGPVYAPRELRQGTTKRGYKTVSVHGRRFYVHDLVLRTFVGPRPAGQQARHRNGVRGDNRSRNLRWGTPSENQLDRRKHGTSNAGERNGHARLTAREVRKIRSRFAAGETQQQIAADFDITRQTVGDIHRRKSWRHLV